MRWVRACTPAVRPSLSDVQALPEAPIAPTEDLPEAPLEGALVGEALGGDGVVDTGAEVFDRLRARLSPPYCVVGANNRAWRQRYAGYPDAFARHLRDILPLLAYVSAQVERADLPGEFALIPIVESWYRPDALGFGGPAGLWQMIASTGRNNGLHIESGYDGRLSPIESTAAALAHLQTLHASFGDWRATAMAYNAGEYRLQRALQRSRSTRVSGERRLPAGLSRTTYDYVAKLQALACLLAEPQRQGLSLPCETGFTPLGERELPAAARSLDDAGRALMLDARALRQLNPAYRHGRISAGAPRRALAPTGLLPVLTTATEAEQHPAITPPSQHHIVQRGDTLSALARRYGIGLQDLLRWNRLQLRSVLRLGQRLRVSP